MLTDDDLLRVAELIAASESRLLAAIDARLRAGRPAELDRFELDLLIAVIEWSDGEPFTARSVWDATDPAVVTARRDAAGSPRELGGLLAKASGGRLGNVVLRRHGRRPEGLAWVFVPVEC